MANYIVTDTELTSIANSIRTKGSTNESLSFPEGFVNAIENISTGSSSQGGAVTAKEVNFRDYDGTVVYSYTPVEFAALTAMPANPDHSGDAIPLTSQGWNWSFADAQAYVAKHGQLEVGQMYATADGKTHVLIHLEQSRTSPRLGVCPNGTVDVDWGDGTAHDTLTGTSVTTVKWTPTHNYATPGDYDIKLTCSGTMGFYGNFSSYQYCGLLRYTTDGDSRNMVYQKAIQTVYCADNVTKIGFYAFGFCSCLTSITLPNSMTSIDGFAFKSCYSLTSITLPDGVTNIASDTLSDCDSLTSVILPNSVTIIDGNVFANCSRLTSIILPDNVTSIGGYAFASCYNLTNIILSDNVTSIGTYAFQNCYNLTNITIPSNVANIYNYAITNCYGLAELHFRPATPPTAAGKYTFSYIPMDCKIYVPTGSLEAYKTATNYPGSAYTHVEE